MSLSTRAFIRGKNKVGQNEKRKKLCGFSYSKYVYYGKFEAYR